MKHAPHDTAGFRVAIAFVVTFSLCAVRTGTATPFQNLDFESAVIGTPVNGRLPASQALPYWMVFPGMNGTVWYDDIALDNPSVSLHDRLDTLGMKPLQGNYSVAIKDGWGMSPDLYDAWISQTGDVPGNAKSLMFITDSAPAEVIARFRVSLNAITIPMYVYSVRDTDSNGRAVYTYYGDVSAFSGQTNVALKFDKLIQDPNDPSGDHAWVTLDAIQFSTIIVPEPSALVLLGVAILSLAGYFWRRRL
jgi:hypothetical protein